MTDISKKIADGTDQTTILRELRDEKVSIIDAIKIVRSAYGVSLGEAKQIVTSDPAWRDIAEQNEPLHDALVESLKDGCGRN